MKARRLLAGIARWSLRAAAAAALLAAAAALVLRSEWAGRWAAGRTEAALAEAAGRPARVGGARLSVFPPGVRVRDVRLARADGSFDSPMLGVREASAAVSLEALLRGRLVVDVVEADGVEVAWGPEEAARPARPRERRAGRRVELRRLLVREGVLAYRGARAPFSVDVSGLEAAAAAPAGCAEPPCLEGAARSGRVEIVYDDHRLTGDGASVSFALRGRTLEVPRFSVAGPGLRSSGRAEWRLEASGAATTSGAASTTGPATESLLGSLPLRARSLDVTASLAVEGGRVRAEGSGRLEGLDYPDLALAERAEGTFTYGEGALTAEVALSGVTPRLGDLAPAAAGEAEVRIARGAAGDVTLRLRTGPILYRDLLARLDPRLPEADVLARAEGAITWRAGDPASLGGAVDVTLAPFAPGGGGAGRIALDGRATFHPGPEAVRLTEGRIAMPGLEAGVAGSIARGDPRLDLVVDLRRVDLETVLPLLPEIPAAAAAHGRGLAGTLAGSLRLTGPPAAIQVDGRLEGPALTVAEGSAAGPFAAAAEFGIRGPGIDVRSLRLGGAGWSASGSLALDTSRAWPLRRARIDLDDLPGGPVWPALGAPWLSGGAISGTVDFSLEGPVASGGPGGSGAVRLEASDLAVSSLPVAEARLDAAVEGPRIRIRSLTAASPGGTLAASGLLDPETREGEFDVRTDRLDVRALLEALAPGSGDHGGVVAFDGKARLSRGGLSLDGEARASDLKVRGLLVGPATAALRRAPEGPGGIEAQVSAPELGASGTIATRPGGYDVDLGFTDLDLGRLRPLLPAGAASGLGGTASGKIHGTLAAGDLPASDLAARLDAVTLRAGGWSLASAAPTLATLRHGEVRLSSTRLTGEGTDVTLDGVYDLRGRRAGAGRLSGRFDAGVLSLVLPEVEARGPVDVEIHAAAGEAGLVYGGRLRAGSVWINHPGSPSPVEHLKLSAEVAPDGTLRVEGIAFSFAGGEVEGEGTGRMQGIDVARLKLDLRGRNMRSEPIPDLNILFDGEATLHKEGVEGRLEGRLDVVRAVYSREFGLEAAPRFTRSPSAPEERLRPGGPSLALSFDIVAPGEVWVRNETARLEGSARLQIAGTFSRPEVTGRITLFEGGTFRFREVTYRSEGGGLDFDDPDVIDPLLDLSAATQVREYAITLRVSGRYSHPRFDLTSEPALPPRDIVALLVTGKTYLEGFGQDVGTSFLAEENVGQYLTAPIAEGLSSTLGRALRLTSVQIDPRFLNGRADPTARVTLTKRVGPQLLFVYSTNVGSSQEQIYQFEYDLSTIWQLIGTRDVDGSISGDLRFRRRWGGPGGRREDAPPPPRPPEIARVEVAGAGELDAEDLRKSAGVKPGRTFRRADALEGRENLRAWLARHGYPMAGVRMTEVPAGGGDGVALRYDVSLGPRVDLEVGGARREKALKKAVLESWEDVVDAGDLEAAGARALEASLGLNGRAAARIASSRRQSERSIRIAYAIDAGPEVSVRSIGFHGASAVPEEELRRAMETREDRWNTTGKLRPAALARDREAIRAVYLGRGHLDVKVGEPLIALSPDRRHAEVRIPIEEGEPWRLGAVVLEGAVTYPAAALREATLLREGDVLRPSAVETARERIRDLLDANGYNAAKVRSRIDGPPARAAVTFTIEEGPRQTLDKVVVRGNTRTNHPVIAREVSLGPGEPLGRDAILETQRKLYALGLFRAVDVEAVPDPDDPSRARMVVQVEEGDPLLTAWGAGYNSEERIQGFGQIGHNNLFGTGRAASLLLRGSSVSRRAQFTLSDRRLFGIPFDGLITSFWELRERESFKVRRAGGALQLSRKLSSRVTALGRYSLEKVSAFDVELTRAEETDIGIEDVRLANVGASIARDTRDDILEPGRGTFATGDLRLYLTPLGSTQQLARAFTSLAAFGRLGRSVVAAGSVRLGLARPLASTNRVPLAERFFAGGDTTLRGFDPDEAGPLDPNTLLPAGGELTVLLNGELRFPVYGALKGVVFYDAGNTFFKPGEFRWSGTAFVIEENVGRVALQDGIRHVLGAGLRLDTPLGPLRLEYGRKMDRRFEDPCYLVTSSGGALRRQCRTESPYEIFLSIGQAF